MKKLLTAITIVAMLSISSSAMAAGVKVPKNVCLAITETIISLSLTTSKGGTAVVSGKEKIKHYGIEGSMNINGNSYPVHGSGYANGENFNFALTSTWTAAPHVQVVNVQGTWNLVTGTGTADLSNMGTGTIESIFGNIDLLDCSTYTLSDTTETDERSLESPVGNLGTSLAQ